MKFSFLLIYIASYEYGFGHQSRCHLLSEYFKKKRIYHKKINLVNKTKTEIQKLILRSNKIILDITNQSYMIKNRKLFNFLINLLSNNNVYIFDSFDRYSINAKIKNNNFKFIIPYLYKFINKKNLYEGTKYFPIRANNLNKKKYINKKIKNILISFGGSDKENYSSKILLNLNKKKYKNLNVIVTVGNFQKTINNSNFIFNLKFIKTNNLLPYLKWSDLSFISNGLTKYESIYCRSPSIILEKTNKDSYLNRFLKRKFLGFYVNQKSLFQNFEYFFDIFSNIDLRKKIFRNTYKVINNNSISKIFKILTS